MGFNASLSGISAANADLSVTANNIANANTVGFKESRAEFANVLTSTGYGLQSNAMGSGARLTNVAQQFSQGNIDQTGRSLDLAIAGEGFFTLNMDGARVYSRAGNFQPDKNGYIVNPQGARLQVYGASADGTRFDGALTDLRLLSGDSAPRPTSGVKLAFTLPANSKEPSVTPFDPATSNSYNHSSGGITVYDSLGVSHTQTSYFVKTANPNEWQVYNFVDGVPVNDGSVPGDPNATPPVPAVIGNPTTLTFSDSGTLTAPTSAEIELGTFTPGTGAGQLVMRLDISGSTQYGEKFNQHNTGQDGYASGKLNEVSISEKGVVFAHYSNGVDVALGQVALTNFNSPQGLLGLGNNLWSETFASGTPRTGAPDSSDLGLIEGGALEASTVDLTQQLVNMITAQRNFQANAQMLSTQDQVTQTVINIR